MGGELQLEWAIVIKYVHAIAIDIFLDTRQLICVIINVYINAIAIDIFMETRQFVCALETKMGYKKNDI